MKELEKLMQQLAQNQRLQQEIAKAKAAFRFKPFVEEYLPLKQLVRISRPFLGVFSVVTGFGFLFGQLSSLINLYVAVILSFILLILIELLKDSLSEISLKQLYKGAKTGYLLAFLGLLIFTFSVFFSVEGARTLYQKLDNSQEELTAHFEAKRDSLTFYYQVQINKEKAALQAYKQSVSWQGKINIANKTTQQIISGHTTQIERLQAKLDEKLNLLFFTEKEKTAALLTNNQFNQNFWMLLSLGVELSIILCLWFSVYYPYKVQSEAELIRLGGNPLPLQTYQFSTESLGNLFQTFQLYATGNGERIIGNNGRNNTGIGFKTNETPTVTNGQNNSTAGVTSETPTVSEGNVRNGVPSREASRDGYRIRCEYCKRESLMKSPQAKYCCEHHRLLHHRQHYGKYGNGSLKIPFP